MGAGLGTIQDENDSNQDSDFSGDEEEKAIKEAPPLAENSDDCGDDLKEGDEEQPIPKDKDEGKEKKDVKPLKKKITESVKKKSKK